MTETFAENFIQDRSVHGDETMWSSKAFGCSLGQ